MNSIVIFGGTFEGRRLAEHYRDKDISATVCVATDYGESLIEESDSLKARSGRLTEEQMEKLFAEKQPSAVIDATHPYAAEVTANIRKAVSVMPETEYIRVTRREWTDGLAHCRRFESIADAVSYLNTTEGNILLTTGSKELASYSGIKDRESRVFARALPLASVVSEVEKLGYRGKNLICMQGPFSEEINSAMINMLGIRYLVTKDTGAAGGLPQKLSAAEKTGAEVILIGKPEEDTGMTVEECISYIDEKYDLKERTEHSDFRGSDESAALSACGFVSSDAAEKKPRTVTICGMGMGDERTMTVAARKAVEEADVVIGAGRLLESSFLEGKKTLKEINSAKIAEFIISHGEFEKTAVVMSGDTGFYSGATKLRELLGGRRDIKLEVLCGISSAMYFLNKIGVPWQNVGMHSAHGRECNFIGIISRSEKSFFLLGGDMGAGKFIKTLVENGLGFTEVYIGENLSYKDEKITSGTAEELEGTDFAPLSVAFVKNDRAKDRVITAGIEDDRFIRGDVPMTKEEVRAVTVSKLRLTENSIVYDIGAGTGSVSVECALRCSGGRVFAIEKNREGCELTEANKKAMGAFNLTVIEGEAPCAMDGLPAPTHAFIGGSSGNMREIIEALLERNPDVRIVINTVTLESLAEAEQLVKEFFGGKADIVQMNVAKNRRAGRYNLMTAQNPVYIISCGGKASIGAEDRRNKGISAECGPDGGKR